MESFLNNEIWKDKPYTLSLEKDKLPLIISRDIVRLCARQDIFVLDFLNRSYRKGLNGLILNTEDDLNPELQTSTFLGALHKSLQNKFLGLVFCPDAAIIKWHYYIKQCGMFEVEIAAPETKINGDSGTIILVSFSHIKLLETLLEHTFFSVIIDRLDEVATKLIIRKLQGNFKIGITYRNFYVQPDQKLQWTMLNWSNPGCVGKLADFYEIDNDNFAHFRDNYKEWWLRMSWNLCDSFTKPSLEEKGKLSNVLREWAKEHGLLKYALKQRICRTQKTKIQIQESEDDKTAKKAKRVYKKTTGKRVLNEIPYIVVKKSDCKSSDSEDSSATIIYDALEEDALPKRDRESLSNTGELSTPKKSSVTCMDDDESDNFLKSVATGGVATSNIKRSGEQYINSILNGEKSSFDLEHDDVPTESDIFLKEICSLETSIDNIQNNYIYTSDVDSLLAKAEEVARQ